MITLQETIRPSADLRNHYNEISRQCREEKEVVSYEAYKNMKARLELLEILAEAEEDVKNNRVAPMSDTFDDLRTMLQEG